jgi:hypothetical protein
MGASPVATIVVVKLLSFATDPKDPAAVDHAGVPEY